ncbi:MAG TPA: hypothetical protein ENG69_03070 [Candidatus Korarchaeota archaeon]|nr:hypothetical protein [Candidatus Korarchaeota archaeon]
MSLAILSLFEALRTIELAGESVDRGAVSRAIRSAAEVYWREVPELERESMRSSFEILEKAILLPELTAEEEEVVLFAAEALLEAERVFGIDGSEVIRVIERELRSSGQDGLADLTMMILSFKLKR